MNSNLKKHEENVTYEFIPGQDENDQAWNIRILEGMYSETIIQYGAIAFNETEQGVMTFNYNIISSPDPDLTEADLSLQECVGDILQEIIRASIEADDGTIAMREVSDKE